MKERKLISAESVTEGHPDKLCDQIADSILDDMLRQDPSAHVAVEVCACVGQFVVFGEVRGEVYTDIPGIVRKVVRNVGYTSSTIGLDADSCGVMVSLTEQSSEINQGVQRIDSKNDSISLQDRYSSQGAGDQGVMFGYASDETDSYMPLPIYLAHKLAYRLAKVRKDGIMQHLRPDGKTQVTIEYGEDGNPKRVDTVLISTQHDPNISHDWLQEQLVENVVNPVFKETLENKVSYENYRMLVNPTGSFVLGGPAADSGLTGRKIIVDTYGGAAHHGGGAFSGKDPSKVDRSAAYAARWVAKNIVAAGLAHKAEVQVAYAIGIAEPVSVNIETFGTETSGISCDDISKAVRMVFDLRPAAIIDELNLLRPIYAKTASYGHFGRTDVQFPWENLDRVEDLKHAISSIHHQNC